MNNSISIQQKVQQLTLSVPAQASLMTGLAALVVWTLYFSPYPPAHDGMHPMRHGTAAVACH